MFLFSVKYQNTLKLIFFIKISSFLLFSCVSDDGGSFEYGTPDTTPPTVSSTFPSDSENDSITGGHITVKFSEAMNLTTMTTNTSAPVDTSCWGTIQVSSDNFTSCVKMSTSVVVSNTQMRGSKAFSVLPTDNLSTSTQYKIRVTTGARDSSGNSMDSQFETSNGFKTLNYHSKGCRAQNKIFVAVGDSGTILISSDGASWTPRTSPNPQNLNQVFCADNTIVAVGNSGSIQISSDNGNSWTESSVPEVSNLYQVTHGNDTFVVVGGSGLIYTSSDNGSSWDSRTSSTSNQLNAVTYANGTFVAVGASGTIRTSSDNGNSWTSRDNDSDTINDITYGNGTFVAVGNNGSIQTSSDNGSSFDDESTGSDDFKKIIFKNNTFVTVGEDLVKAYSTDNGTTWYRDFTPYSSYYSSNGFFNDIAYGNGKFVTVGDDAYFAGSETGTWWSYYDEGCIATDKPNYYSYCQNYIESITYSFNLGIFVIVGATDGYSNASAVIHSSVDGKHWSLKLSGSYGSLNDVIYLD